MVNIVIYVVKTIKKIKEKKIRIIFFGSQDNLNYRFAKWFYELGYNIEVFSFEIDLGRSQPELIDPKNSNIYPEWFNVHKSLIKHFPYISSKLQRKLEKKFDIMIVSGTRGLLAARKFNLPKILLAIGGEVSEAPFPFAGRWRGVDAFIYRMIRWPFARNSLKKMDFIIENYSPNLVCLKKLGLIHKRSTLPIAEDIESNKKNIDFDLLNDLEKKYKSYEKVFLFLTRLNFISPKDPAYKGSDRFLKAAKEIINELKESKIRLIIGTHGHDVMQFMNLASKEGLDEFIDWVPHLNYKSLLTYLSLSKAVLFSKFGENLNILTGIDRDAISIGTVTVTSFDPDLIVEMYGSKPPFFRATSVSDIKLRMREVTGLQDNEIQKLKKEIQNFGINYLDYRHILPRYEKLFNSLIQKKIKVS
tara:strand:- start:1228 stop:2478 length:1251 start_codon:yes stop_codon:yes gene_type:complete